MASPIPIPTTPTTSTSSPLTLGCKLPTRRRTRVPRRRESHITQILAFDRRQIQRLAARDADLGDVGRRLDVECHGVQGGRRVVLDGGGRGCFGRVGRGGYIRAREVGHVEIRDVQVAGVDFGIEDFLPFSLEFTSVSIDVMRFLI